MKNVQLSGFKSDSYVSNRLLILQKQRVLYWESHLQIMRIMWASFIRNPSSQITKLKAGFF